MEQYKKLLQHILDNGITKSDRTGTGTISTFGYQMRFDLSQGFPLLTTKKMFMRGITHELLWFLKGDTNVRYLQENNVHIWDEWATAEQCAKFQREEGELGYVYGHLWRNFGGGLYAPGTGVDQISNLIKSLKSNPDSRRHIVSGWDPKTCDRVALPPCHTLFQFYVGNGKLSCQLYQRSADVFLGVPFNIASYALLTMMVAQVCDLGLGEFVHTIGDAHLYSNHIEQTKLQLTRDPMPLPTVRLNPAVKDIFAFKYEDITLENYQSHPAIKAPISI